MKMSKLRNKWLTKTIAAEILVAGVYFSDKANKASQIALDDENGNKPKITDLMFKDPYEINTEHLKAYQITGKQIREKKMEREYLDSLLMDISSVPSGKRALKSLGKSKSSLAITMNAAIYGGYSSKLNGLYINPVLSGKKACCIFVHEARHIDQLKLGLVKQAKYNPFEAMTLEKVIEADAEAHAAQFAYQRKLKGDSSYIDMGKKGPYKHCYIEYEKQAKKDSNSIKDGRALKAAYDGWFKNKKQVKKYEQNLVMRINMLPHNYSHQGDSASLRETIINIGKLENGNNYILGKDKKVPNVKTYANIDGRINLALRKTQQHLKKRDITGSYVMVTLGDEKNKPKSFFPFQDKKSNKLSSKQVVINKKIRQTLR